MSDNKKDKEILDADADGLTDEEEQKLGTDPDNPDTDYDGLGDYQEVNVYKTDPTDRDSDHDDIEDGIEVMLGRNPKGTGILSDLFIPSARNNYRPKALHPHRLMFHAFAAVAIKVVMVGFLLSFPIQAWLSPDVLYEQSQKIVQLTNNFRQSLNLGTLTVNTSLQNAALNKAQDMLVNEYFSHVGPDNKSLRTWLLESGYAFRVAGENLAIGFSSAESVFSAWQKSPTHYANIIDPEFTEIGVGAVNGTYKGYETTLVAQYFGQPKTENTVIEPTPTPEPETPVVEEQPAPEPTPEPEIPTNNENTNIPEPETPVVEEQPAPEPENTEVLGEQEVLEPLATPVLLEPNDEFVSKENLVNLQVQANNADKVSIFANDELIVSKDVESGFTNFVVNLNEGNYNINLVAYRGDEAAKSSTYKLAVDKTAPVLENENAYILVNKPIGQDDIVMKATAYLDQDTTEAEVVFGDYVIALNPDYSDDEGKWTGSLIVEDADYDDMFNAVVLATLVAKDDAGNTLTQDIDWQDITPVKNSAVKQYLFVKNNPSEYIQPLFSISSVYFKIILALAIFALLLNILVEFKKQHPHTIMSTLGLIVLISFLTIF
ncbi:hypothetical protein C0580_02820 [Candidatus Parcubacteria bacterium]|nr:MAG: hypothetical protein C0580_02820 [Candidatus Parcubacteria bacterium]